MIPLWFVDASGVAHILAPSQEGASPGLSASAREAIGGAGALSSVPPSEKKDHTASTEQAFSGTEL